MQILIAEDEPVSRTLLQSTLSQWGYEIIPVADGTAAWEVLRQLDAPLLAILDWEMPGHSGIDICRMAHAKLTNQPLYLILLTVRDSPADLVMGLESGANDYLTKPFLREELAARLKVARRILELQQSLSERVAALESALADVRRLRGILPLCAWCKKVRTDQNYWQQVEVYLAQHTHLQFTHNICPDCFTQQMAELNKVSD